MSRSVVRDRVAAAVLVAFGAGAVAAGSGVPPGVATDPLGPRAFPVALGAGIAICGILLAAGTVVMQRPGAPSETSRGLDPDDDAAAGAGPFSAARLVGAVALTGVYLAAFEALGYLLATPLYVLGVMLLHGSAPPRSLVLTPPVVAVLLYATFRFGLLIPLPDGILEPLLR